MAHNALVTTRGGRTAASHAKESAAALAAGASIVIEAPYGVIVSGTDAQYRALEEQGLRVKALPDTTLLGVGRYVIDVTANPPDVPAALDVSAADAPQWPHHLVQLAGPPADEWTRAIEQLGADVVEPISRYGLFVHATSEVMRSVRALPFVVWTGLFKPAYRVLGSSEGEPDLALHRHLSGRRARSCSRSCRTSRRPRAERWQPGRGIRRRVCRRCA